MLIFVLVLTFSNIKAQEIKVSSSDAILKERIYQQNKKKVSKYLMKQFDALFFEFFDKKANANLVLTKQEFY